MINKICIGLLSQYIAQLLTITSTKLKGDRPNRFFLNDRPVNDKILLLINIYESEPWGPAGLQSNVVSINGVSYKPVTLLKYRKHN